MQFFDGSDLNNELKQVNLSTLSNNYAARCNQRHPLKEEKTLEALPRGKSQPQYSFKSERLMEDRIEVH